MISHSIKNYFSDERNISLLNEALEFLNIEKAETENKGESLKGLVFVVTGEVEKFKNRKELQQKIEELGGAVTGSVSGKTNYLINNDIHSQSSKTKRLKR